jgi:hypothetical protein
VGFVTSSQCETSGGAFAVAAPPSRFAGKPRHRFITIAVAFKRRHSTGMKLFWTCFVVDSIVFAVLFYFFLVGRNDGSVNSFNIALWLTLIGIPALLLWGALHLKNIGRPRLATGLLALLGVPGFFVGGWMLLLIILYSMHPGAVH